MTCINYQNVTSLYNVYVLGSKKTNYGPGDGPKDKLVNHMGASMGPY